MSARPPQLHPLRKVVTSNDNKGIGVVESDTLIETKDFALVPGAKGALVWVAEGPLPVKDNNTKDDGATRRLDPTHNFGMVPRGGANFQTTELAPGVVTAMHRTSSLDYNILLQGEVTLIMEDGSETTLKNTGDIVITKGGLHAWRNASDTTWARWLSVLIDAEPAVVDGRVLEPEWKE